jgi:hypothetical protein
MIITSVTNGANYFWVKVPRTATTSYERLFFPSLTPEDAVEHYHLPFYAPADQIKCPTPAKFVHGFSVVRHPLQRFTSLMRYLSRKRSNPLVPGGLSAGKKHHVEICEYCGDFTRSSLQEPDAVKNYTEGVSARLQFVNFLENEDIFYDFLYSTFYKNCEVKDDRNFNETFQTENPSLVKAIFLTQTHLAYHPKVKIFRYENLPEFNSWIKTTLGYDTSLLQKLNTTSQSHKFNIDVTTNKFKQLAEYLFHDDFKLFNYTT